MPAPSAAAALDPGDDVARTILAAVQVLTTANLAAEHPDGRPADDRAAGERALAIAEVLRAAVTAADPAAYGDHYTAHLRDAATAGRIAADAAELAWSTLYAPAVR